jgi:DNA-binding protein HU-beta
MNKAELIAALAEKSGQTKTASEQSLNALIDVVTETLAKGESIQLIGFGTFGVGARAERQGRNPQTGAALTIAASKVARFTPGAKLKEAVNSGK